MSDPEVVAEEAVPAETPTEETVETPEGFIALEAHQKDVNVQHKRFRDEERGRVKEKTRADSLQERLDKIEAEKAEVTIPPAPDPYSDTYADDLSARDDAIARKAQQDADIDHQAAEREKLEEARQAKANEAITEKVRDFDAKMVEHGLNPAETKAAADKVIEYGISDTFQDVLLEDKDGPLFVQYLAANPIELDEMSRMSPYQLINHLNGDIRQRASLLKPKTSEAPDPPVTLSGGGAPETAEAWEKGATYE